MEDEEIPYYKEVKEEGDGITNKLRRISTSALLFILSFIASNMLLQVLVAWFSLGLKYSIKFSYNQVRVFPWDYHYWSRTNIVIIFLFSPAICFALGVLIFNLLRIYTNWQNVSRIFFFWLSVNLINLVLTHALLSPLGTPIDRNNGLYQTFAVVGVFLWINPTLMTFVSVGSLAASLLLGAGIRKEVMRYSFSKTLIGGKKGMDVVAIQVFVLPILAGSLPVILLCSPVGFFTTVMALANLGIVSIGIFMMNSIGTSTVRCIKSDVLNHFPFIELAICSTAWFIVFTFFK